jgi:hypothetical protein
MLLQISLYVNLEFFNNFFHTYKGKVIIQIEIYIRGILWIIHAKYGFKGGQDEQKERILGK